MQIGSFVFDIIDVCTYASTRKDLTSSELLKQKRRNAGKCKAVELER